MGNHQLLPFMQLIGLHHEAERLNQSIANKVRSLALAHPNSWWQRADYARLRAIQGKTERRANRRMWARINAKH